MICIEQVEQKLIEKSANTQYFEKLRDLADKKPYVWRAMKQREMEIRQMEEQVLLLMGVRMDSCFCKYSCRLVLSCRVVSCRVVSCRVVSCLVLSCLFLALLCVVLERISDVCALFQLDVSVKWSKIYEDGQGWNSIG